jgi:hypothetical protein
MNNMNQGLSMYGSNQAHGQKSPKELPGIGGNQHHSNSQARGSTNRNGDEGG